MIFIRSRFPKSTEIIPVYGFVVFVIHSWAISVFLNRLPSWIMYTSSLGLLLIFAYTMAFAFLESLLVMAILLIISFILPSKWYKGGFAFKGFITVLVGAISSIQFQKNLPTKFPSMHMLYNYLGVTLFAIIGLILLAQYVSFFQKILLFVGEKFTIMLYLYFPLGLISLIAVTWRILI